MLEIRPNCECCDRDLPPESGDAYLCTFECTWCADCVSRFPDRRCPNCAGNLERRPVRPAQLLDANPASTQRVVSPDCARRYLEGQDYPLGKEAAMDGGSAAAGAHIDWALQDRIIQVATAARAVGVNDPAYTGSVVDVANARLRIYRKRSIPDEFDLQEYRALAPPGVSTTFETAPLSARETEILDRLIIALVPEFQAAGIKISGWGLDYAGGVRVDYWPGTVEIPQHLREKLEIYGPGTVRFKVGSTVSLADFTTDRIL